MANKIRNELFIRAHTLSLQTGKIFNQGKRGVLVKSEKVVQVVQNILKKERVSTENDIDKGESKIRELNRKQKDLISAQTKESQNTLNKKEGHENDFVISEVEHLQSSSTQDSLLLYEEVCNSSEDAEDETVLYDYFDEKNNNITTVSLNVQSTRVSATTEQPTTCYGWEAGNTLWSEGPTDKKHADYFVTFQNGTDQKLHQLGTCTQIACATGGQYTCDRRDGFRNQNQELEPAVSCTASSKSFKCRCEISETHDKYRTDNDLLEIKLCSASSELLENRTNYDIIKCRNLEEETDLKETHIRLINGGAGTSTDISLRNARELKEETSSVTCFIHVSSEIDTTPDFGSCSSEHLLHTITRKSDTASANESEPTTKFSNLLSSIEATKSRIERRKSCSSVEDGLISNVRQGDTRLNGLLFQNNDAKEEDNLKKLICSRKKISHKFNKDENLSQSYAKNKAVDKLLNVPLTGNSTLVHDPKLNKFSRHITQKSRDNRSRYQPDSYSIGMSKYSKRYTESLATDYSVFDLPNDKFAEEGNCIPHPNHEHLGKTQNKMLSISSALLVTDVTPDMYSSLLPDTRCYTGKLPLGLNYLYSMTSKEEALSDQFGYISIGIRDTAKVIQIVQQNFDYIEKTATSVLALTVTAEATHLDEVPGREAMFSLPKQIYCKNKNVMFRLEELHGIDVSTVYALHRWLCGANSFGDPSGNGLGNNFRNLVNYLLGQTRNSFNLGTIDDSFNGEQSIQDEFYFILDFKTEKDYISHHFQLKKLYEQMKLQEQLNTKLRYRLIVVTAEVFENAMRQYQIENYKVTLSNYFPTNCRLFIGIPVYKDGLINRRDRKDRS